MEEREERDFPAEPDEFEDEEDEEFDEPRASRRRFRIVLLGVLVLAAVGAALFYLPSWWSGPLPPPSPPEVAKSESPPPPTPVIPAEVSKPVLPRRAAPAPAPAERAVTSSPVPTRGEFWVQVGAFANSKNAQRLSDRLTAERYPVVTRPSESSAAFVVVRVGGYPDREKAEAARAELEKRGVTGFVLRRKPQ